MMKEIPFNRPYITGGELINIKEAINQGKLSGNGDFTKKCQSFFENKYGINKALLTTSCTDALEMCAILVEISIGDEVIVPSFTFVSTALAFVREGAKIVFADSYSNNPNIDANKIEELITKRTKAIVVTHYAGVSCDMEKIMTIASRYNLIVIEDAAQGIDSYYKNRALGSLGHLATFSFHETKNIISGEGGILAINDTKYCDRAEKIWEKGTNRAEFIRGEVKKYSWVDKGSSFLPSELIAAFLYAQLEKIEIIQKRRKEIWERYNNTLMKHENKGYFSIPIIPRFASNNAHMYYIVCRSYNEREDLLNYLKSKNISAAFHYLSLHSSKYYSSFHDNRILSNCDRFANCLLRLPLFPELTDEQIDYINQSILFFFNERSQGMPSGYKNNNA